MNNPYEILEINPSATDEQVKHSYLVLQKKYHPDNYDPGPLKDLAVQKTKEITDAFDEIMNTRRKEKAKAEPKVPVATMSEHDQASGEQVWTATDSEQTSTFLNIRSMLNNNQLVDAEEMLNNIVQNDRNAEWYFLKGKVFFARGWIDDAENYFSTAVRMDPQNTEYRGALDQLVWQKQGNYGNPSQNGPYRQPGQAMGGCSVCDVCTGMLCADCCCECAGGDCIRGC